MKILDPTSWLNENQTTYSNGCPISEVMEGYAKYYHQQKNSNSPTTKDYDHVNIILEEASTHGLRGEVDMTAQTYLNDNKELTIIEAYTYAYNDWVK